jgi:nickel-dependent lactate racemase
METQYAFPTDWRVTTIEANVSTALPDLRAAIEATLASPINSLPLRKMARHNTNVCIVFTDATRACPDAILIPPLLRELAAADVPSEQITLLCATGMHRPSTFEEKIAKVGMTVAQQYTVVDHQAQNPEALVNLGSLGRPDMDLPADVPTLVNRIAAEADLLIATGVVEPHQYAGYSGGGKTVAVGCGGEATITATHGAAFLDDNRVRLGRVASNPFQAAMRECARRAGLKFVVNVVLDGDGRAAVVQAGDPISVHDRLVAFAKRLYEVPVPGQYDVVVAGIGGPKDANLYQASRAPTHVGLASQPVVREGGVIITPARCPEGAGQGPGEQRFYEMLSKTGDLRAMLDDLRRRGIQAGEQRAFMLAQVLLKHAVIIVGSEHPDVIHTCKMTPASTMDEAVTIARGIAGDHASALVIPHSLQTLPVIESV